MRMISNVVAEIATIGKFRISLSSPTRDIVEHDRGSSKTWAQRRCASLLDWIPAFAGMTALLLSACSTNPATGDRQFTALMSPGAENQMGASEHPKILEQFGGVFPDQMLEAYVGNVGRKVAANTERSDVQYKFFVLDTPTVNAFAMPGGYIYVTRGLLGLANSESELAGVLAHEIGHITARHSAERYSQGLVAGLGLAVLGAAVDTPGVSRAAGVGTDLVLKSYSRSQEYQADELGIRYLSRAGYDTFAMASFLNTLDANTKHEARLKSRGGGGANNVMNYFSTHPQTDDRVARASQIATGYPGDGRVEAAPYLHQIDGMTYGDSARSGFMRGQTFIHPEMGFTLTFPRGFDVTNQPDKILAVNDDGAGIIFDGVANRAGLDPVAYLQAWVGAEKLPQPEAITINGMRAATGAMSGSINGQTATIRVVAVEWSPSRLYRFQVALPGGGSRALEEDMKRMTYSLRPISADERGRAQTLKIDLVTARAGDTVESLAQQMRLNDEKDDPVARFRVLNALGTNGTVKAGQIYKIVR